MFLGSTQPLTEISIRDNSWEVKAAGGFGAEYQPPSCADRLETLGVSTFWNPRDPIEAFKAPSRKSKGEIHSAKVGLLNWYKVVKDCNVC